MSKQSERRCIGLLDGILFTDGKFQFDAAKLRLQSWKTKGEIDVIEYCNFLDACNCRHEQGHYRNSLIYKRAQASAS